MPTEIEWTDETWNPTTGCTKISLGCKHCYAKRHWARLTSNPRTVYYSREFEQVAIHPERLELPKQWRKPRRIFVDSMSDLFHIDIPTHFIKRVFTVMAECQRHTFQVLTKRADRMWSFFEAFGPPTANVMIGVSAEDQFTWDERLPFLLDAKVDRRFVSLEPLLGPIDGRSTNMKGLISPIADWPIHKLNLVIVGGESGPNARPTHSKWVRTLRDQAQLNGVPFFFKQWGEWLPTDQCNAPLGPSTLVHAFDDGEHTRLVGKRAAGRTLDGEIHDGDIC